MPIIKSAIKKMRKDIKREKLNRAKKTNLKNSLKKAQRSKKEADIIGAISLLDKAVKIHLVHKNKAARLKSRLAKLAGKKKLSQPKVRKRASKPAKSEPKA